MALEAWLREQRDRLSSKSETAKAINYCLTRWSSFTRFLDDMRRRCLCAADWHYIRSCGEKKRRTEHRY